MATSHNMTKGFPGCYSMMEIRRTLALILIGLVVPVLIFPGLVAHAQETVPAGSVDDILLGVLVKFICEN